MIKIGTNKNSLFVFKLKTRFFENFGFDDAYKNETIRFMDKNIGPGDYILLKEWDDELEAHTGRCVYGVVIDVNMVRMEELDAQTNSDLAGCFNAGPFDLLHKIKVDVRHIE